MSGSNNSAQQQAAGGNIGGFLGKIGKKVESLSPQAAKTIKEIDIVGLTSKRRGLYKKHLLKGERGNFST